MSSKDRSLLSVIMDIDDINMELSMAIDSLVIADESLDEEVSFLRKHPSFVEHFADRYKMSDSLMSLCRMKLCELDKRLSALTEEALSAVRALENEEEGQSDG